MGRISGPLLDRIDLHLEVIAVPFQELAGKAEGSSSTLMRDQVLRARAAQSERFGEDTVCVNGRMSGRLLRKHAALNVEGRKMMEMAMTELGISARAHDRILRVARTIADIDGTQGILPAHLAEAISYRTLDRKLWRKG